MTDYEYEIINSKYGKIAVPTGYGWRHSNGLVDNVQKKGIYEPQTVNFIKNNINNKSIVHCGAAFGDMLPAFSQFTEKTVYAYEANPLAAFCARKTIDINQLHNVNLTEIGLGDKETKVDFIYEYENGMALVGGSRFVDSKVPKKWDPKVRWKNAKTLKIQIKKLDDILNDEISIIHLDVEGYETKVLEGAMNLIQTWNPILILEEVDARDEMMRNNILPLGYKLINTLNRNTIWKIS